MLIASKSETGYMVQALQSWRVDSATQDIPSSACLLFNWREILHVLKKLFWGYFEVLFQHYARFLAIVLKQHRHLYFREDENSENSEAFQVTYFKEDIYGSSSGW